MKKILALLMIVFLSALIFNCGQEPTKFEDNLTNTAPYFTSVPVTSVTVNQNYEYVVAVADSTDPVSSLTIEIVKKPGWLNYDGANKKLFGSSPNTNLDGIGNEVEIKVTDGLLSKTQNFKITVTQQGQAPTIQISKPGDGNNITVGNTVYISAIASDNKGSIKNVKFYIDDNLVCTDSTVVYEYAWNTSGVSAGSHTIKAIATDNENYTGEHIISVNLTNLVCQITSPTENQEFTKLQTAEIVVNASVPNGTISKVEFYIDGNWVVNDILAPYTYSWNLNSVNPSNHLITVLAYDNQQRIITDQRNIIIKNISPTINITAPTNGQTIPFGNNVNISAATSDLDGTISKVDFYIDNVLIGSDNTASFEYSWNTAGVASGSHTIKAIATDNDGSTGEHSINVTVTAGNVQVTSVSVAPTTASLVVGGKKQLIATLIPASATNKTVTWSSSVPAVASVSSTGLVTGLTAGNSTITVTTQDGGYTATCEVTIITLINPWLKQNSGFTTGSRGINNIFIVDSNIVWATAFDGTQDQAKIQEFTKTTNGGTTWTPYINKISLPATSYGISNLSPLSANIAWAAIYPQTTTLTGCGIFKTTDGGASWTKQSTALFNTSTSFPNFVHMFDANNGVCMGDPSPLTGTTGSFFEIYTTTNGGINWTRVPKSNIASGATPVNGEYGIVNMFSTIGNTIWFGTNKGNVLKSTDKGLTWTKVIGAPSSYSIVRMSFHDDDNGILSYSNGATTPTYYQRITSDGGATWTNLVATGSKSFNIEPIKDRPNAYISVSAAAGNSFSSYTIDNGTTWTTLDTATQYTGIKMLNHNYGWIGAFNDIENPAIGGIYKWVGGSLLGKSSLRKPKLPVLKSKTKTTQFKPYMFDKIALKRKLGLIK